jgi:hypothetical protein
MIHRRDCPQIIRYNMFATCAVKWLWADNKTENEIAWWITHLGYKTCMHCRPINWREVSWFGTPAEAAMITRRRVEHLK